MCGGREKLLAPWWTEHCLAIPFSGCPHMFPDFGEAPEEAQEKGGICGIDRQRSPAIFRPRVPRWWNGRRGGLKIRCRKAWGFKSLPGHHSCPREQRGHECKRRPGARQCWLIYSG